MKNDTKTEEIVGIIVNLFLPGLGTIIGATKHKQYMTQGIIQLALAILSIPLCLILIGFILGFAIWVWALITSINMLNE